MTGGAAGGGAGKAGWRKRLLAARRARGAAERADAERKLAQSAGLLPELAEASVVAAYVAVGGEPGTGALLEALRGRGVRVLLPVLRADDDLDWAPYGGPGSLVAAGRGLREPAGPRLGRDAVLGVQVLLLPGLAVDAVSGVRLGRGGGSYDRVLERLARAGARPARVVLLYAEEVLEGVPSEPHDGRVDAAVTPEGVHRF